jgi:predicted helicase
LSRPGGLEWRSLTPSPPNYLLVDQDTEVRTEFLAWPSIAEIFPLHNHGVITKRDGLALQFTEAEVWKVVQDFVACPSADAYQRFGLADDVRDWSVDSAKRDLIASGPTADHIRRLCYRPFNYRFTYYTGRARGFIGWPVERVMRHMLATRNIAIVTTRQTKDVWGLLATRDLAGHKACSGYDVNTVFPLYLVGESDDLGLFSMADSGEPAESSRAPNLDPAFVRRIVDLLGGSGAPGSEAERDADSGPEGVLGYVYGVLHSPEYRRRYVDALRSDYAHVPVPAKRDLYVELTRLGAELLDLHLLESPRLSQPVTKYIGSATPEVVRVAWSDGTVWSHRGTAIGRSGFAGVPEEVWRFHIGGFQVCDKWLKDRVGRVLSAADLAQFQQIVVALSETIRLMGEIDETVNRHGGWPGAFATA